MRHTASTTPDHGRHRWGRPGLVHVGSFVTVAYRSMVRAWLTPGKHRAGRDLRTAAGHHPRPAHAT